MTDEKKAFRVSETLVNVEGILYHITHVFVVKETVVESDTLPDLDASPLETQT